MAKFYVLSSEELDLLFAQNPATARDGGFQHFIVDLQQKARRPTNEIRLDDDDIRRIQHFAFDVGQGGWQGRLMAIFGRVLGPTLGREP